jgi:hypothetical protein
MASADVDRITEEARRLPPDERRRLREALDREEQAKVHQSDRVVGALINLNFTRHNRSERYLLLMRRSSVA